jgi:hypothetical protein
MLEQYARSKVFASGNTQIRRLFEPAFFRKRVDARTADRLNQLGALVGLNQNEVDSTTKHHNSAISRLCSRTVLFWAIVFLAIVLVVLVGANWAAYLEEPISTYTPGTRYASIRPSDFRE